MKNEKWYNFFLGLFIGLTLPFMIFFLYWLFRYSYMSFPSKFIWYLQLGDMWEGVIKLCVLCNLLPFYLFMNKGKNKIAVGIIFASMVFVFYLLYLMYYSKE